jgi:endoglucanase
MASIVEDNGWLSVKNSQIVNEMSQPIALRGMSSHGLQWFGNVVTKDALKELVDTWKIDVFRAAMYTAQGGYAENPSVKNKVIEIVDTAITLGIYVIIDWHILYDNNPQIYQSKAIEFFSEMADKYKNVPNVIYEICNEPNGNISWSGNIKPYAMAVIKAIRAKDPRNLIMIGSGSWSQNIQDPANDPINGTNLVYTLHFYAGTHGTWLADRIDYAMKKGLAIYVSEWGTTGSSGNGALNLDAAKWWLDFLDSRHVGWANWSYSNASESSAALTWNKSLSQSGGWVKDRLVKAKQ